MKEDRNISESPDAWVIIKMTNVGDDFGNTYYKVFASWLSSYLDGERWKINSGVSRVDDDAEFYYFYGMSGSCYACHKKAYGIKTSHSHNVLNNIINNSYKVDIKAEVLPEETDWSNLIKLST